MMNINNSVVWKSGENIIIRMPYTDFDDQASQHFKDNLSHFLEKNKHNVVILDFGKINLIDSTGFAAIMYAYYNCSENGIHMILCNLNENSHKMLKTKGLETMLEVVSTLKEAIDRANNYSEGMKNLCQNLNKMDEVFGSLYEDESFPRACKLFVNYSTLLKAS